MNPTIPNMKGRRGGLAAEQIPNRPLTGTELRERILAVAVYAMKGCLPPLLPGAEPIFPADILRLEFERDQRFNFLTTFPGAQYTITGKFHFTAPGAPDPPRAKWSLQVDFAFTTPHMPTMPVKARTPPPPLDLTDEESGVVAFSVTEKIENPNLVRVHTGLPITVVSVSDPEPGQLFGKIENHAVHYDAKDYPPLPDPVVVDISEETAAQWRIPRWKVPVEGDRPILGKGAARPEPVKEANAKTRYRHMDKEDLDAISEEPPE